MAEQNRAALLATIRKALTTLHGKKAGAAEAERVLKYLTGKDVAYYKDVLNTTKARLLAATSDSPLMQRVLGIVSDKGKARVGADIKKDAGVKPKATAKTAKATEQAATKEASKQALIADDVKNFRRFSASKELIPKAGPARTTFGTAGRAAVGDTTPAIAAQEGQLDQIARLRTKLLDPATDIRNVPGVSNVATGADRARVNKATQITGAARKEAVTKALDTKAARAAFADVESQLKAAGVKGKGLTRMMSNLRKSPSLLAKIGGGVGQGETALRSVAREAAPIASLFGSKTGIGDLFGSGGFGQTGGADKIALAELTKGVGSKVGRLAGKAFRTGIPFAIFEAITVAPRLMREVGLDTEFNEQMGAIDTVSAGISHENLSAQYKEDQLLAQHKARLLEADPMAMQFLMTTMDQGLPQKLTRNEISIGGPQANPHAQDLAGDEITRAFMGV